MGQFKTGKCLESGALTLVKCQSIFTFVTRTGLHTGARFAQLTTELPKKQREGGLFSSRITYFRCALNPSYIACYLLVNVDLIFRPYFPYGRTT